MFLGIGCIIGAGIFVRTGNAAALHAGPAVLFSYIIAGIVRLRRPPATPSCRPRFRCQAPPTPTAIRPSASSRLKQARLLLEYGLAASVVAVGWSGYVVSLLADMGIHVPAGSPGRPATRRSWRTAPPSRPSSTCPAFLICLLLALLLVVGVSESAKVNNLIVAIKVTVLVAFIVVGGFLIMQNYDASRRTWQPFIPSRQAEGRVRLERNPSRCFNRLLRLHRLRSGLYGSPGSEGTEEGHADRYHRFAPGLHGHLHPGLDRPHARRELSRTERSRPGRRRGGRLRAARAVASTIKIGAIIGLTSVILVLMYGQTRIFYTMARDGLLPKVFARASEVPHRINTLVVGLAVAMRPASSTSTSSAMRPVGTLAAFGIVCLTVIWLRQTHPEIPRGYRVPLYPVLPALGIPSCFALIFTVGAGAGFFGWYVIGAIILYFVYGMRNSTRQGPRRWWTDELPIFPEDAR